MEQIEARAEEVLAGLPGYVWDGAAVPVPIDDIADSVFGLLVRELPPEHLAAAPGAPALDPGQELSGLLLAGPGEIWVNATEAERWPARRRFTIAHELGHWVLHRSGQTSLFCRHTTVDPADGGGEAAGPGKSERAKLPEIEAEANAFAAALTMPADLMRAHYERLRDADDTFGAMCRLFAASGAAMGRRLHTVI